MYQKNCFLIASLFLSFIASSQGVVISASSGTPDPSSMLDVQSTTRGILVPRMTQAQRNGIALPQTGLLIFQSDNVAGFYYNSGNTTSPVWTPLLPATAQTWSLPGNAGINPALDFIGTTDNNPLVFRTNNNERMRLFANGQAIINGSIQKSPQDALEVMGSGVNGATGNFPYAINGYSASLGIGVYGENSGNGDGVLGANTGNGIGVYGTSNAGTGVLGYSASNSGISGTSGGSMFAGVRGDNSSVSGTGVIALGNNITSATINPGGSGLAANGTTAGSFSTGSDPATGIGVIGLGNGITSNTNPGFGAGVLAQGETFGLIAYAGNPSSALSNNKWGGYFDYQASANGFCYIGGRTGNTDYAILSTGVKSTMVKDQQNRNRIMYCPETPEVLFEDYGTSQLVNGRVHVSIDPVMSGNIYISTSKPLKVFIQLEGDCKGVYVTNKTAGGFDVIELQKGTSNTPFSYQIVANRADSKDESGRVISSFANNRFPVGPGREEGTLQQTVQVPAKKQVAPAKDVK